MNQTDELSSALFNQGKKLYIIGDYGKSIDFLIKACKTRELLLGHLHADMFEPYFFLAKSYFMYSKSETELIGEGLERDMDAKSNDDKQENTAELLKELVGEVEDETEDENKSENCVQIEKIPDLETKEMKQENLTYLQLAYEAIESGKLILNNQISEKCGIDTKKLELLLADCCDLVGSIYMEEGVMEESVKEYEKALEYRQKHLNQEIDRAIAESYFNLGNIYSSDLRMSEAADAYEKCKRILTNCSRDNIITDAATKDTELSDIIADLDERIADCKDGDRDYQLAKESIKQFLTVTAAVTSGSRLTAANDVTHLIRRRSKPAAEELPKQQQDVEATAGEPPVSKRRLE